MYELMTYPPVSVAATEAKLVHRHDAWLGGRSLQAIATEMAAASG